MLKPPLPAVGVEMSENTSWAEYHTVVCKPTEHQKALVKELSKRAEKVHSGTVDAREDNMLRITSDGRKLGLDQRIINPALPDEANTKVNQCVANILRHWQDGENEKLTQLVFSDISTPTAGKGGFNIYPSCRTRPYPSPSGGRTGDTAGWYSTPSWSC